MGDLFDRYGAAPATKTPDLFDRYGASSAKPAASADVMGGGVQDFEPITTRHAGTLELPNDPVSGWVTTRLRNVATGFAGIPRAIADTNKSVVNALGLPPQVATAANFLNPLTAGGQFMPSSHELNQGISQALPEVNTGGKSGKIVDAGVEAALGGAVLPGAARNIIPSLVGGAASEGAGQATAGTKYEPWARLLGAVIPGGIAALAQNGLGSAVQAIKNIAPNVDETSAKIIARALIRDNDTGNALAGRQADLGPGAMAVEAGGPNVRGTMRGSIAAPGQARTAAQEAFDTRSAQLPDITNNALDKAISPNRSLAGSVEDIATARGAASGPAYEAAGVLQPTETQAAGTRIRPEQVSPERTVKFAIDQPETTIPAQWNTATMESPALTGLYKDSSIVRSAMGQIRGLSEYKNVPQNTMTMWDQVYKVLGGMEREAARGGNDRRAMLIGDERRNVLAAITEQNPRYQRALDAYSGPSKLIDAAERGKEWFTKNVDPEIVKRELAAMSPAEQQAAKEVGLRDWGREIVSTKSGRGPGDMAQRTLLEQGSDRARLQAILSPEEFAALEKPMGTVKNALNTRSDINVGSRSIPMINEQADNALAATGAWTDLLHGRLLSATGKASGKLMDRMATGRTEKVNARIAEMLTSIDPEKVGMVQALAERARLAELARRSGRRNALTYGGVTVPGGSALVGADR